MIRTLSQTEAARRDTVFTRAADVALDRISQRLFSIPRPENYPVAIWAGVLLALVYRPRGTFRVLFGVLDALFSPWRRLLSSQTVTIGADGSFTSSVLHAGHACRFAWFEDASTKEKRLVFVRRVTGTVGYLSRYSSGYWEGWQSAATGTLTFLPFLITEGDGVVNLFLDIELLNSPPNYLQSPGGSTRPATQPDGGHLLNLFDLDPATLNYGDQNIGPYPLYFSGAGAGVLLAPIMHQCLAAGVHLNVFALDWGGVLGVGPLSALPQFGRIGPFDLGS